MDSLSNRIKKQLLRGLLFKQQNYCAVMRDKERIPLVTKEQCEQMTRDGMEVSEILWLEHCHRMAIRSTLSIIQNTSAKSLSPKWMVKHYQAKLGLKLIYPTNPTSSYKHLNPPEVLKELS